jgi:hypothetical protein
MSTGAPSNESTSSAAVTPASPSASQDDAAEQMTLDTFGPTFETPFATYDPATLYWRTYLGISRSDSTEFSLTLPPSGSMRNGRLSRQPMWVPPTSVVASSLWPTPTARDYRTGGDIDRQGGPSLAALMWATPTAHPRTHTPRQVDHGVQLANQVGGALNPTWVEWLMGFPLGWTDCEPSGTQSSRPSLNGQDVG